jgi:hypothetical protein
MQHFPTGVQVIKNKVFFKDRVTFEKGILGQGATISPIWKDAPVPGLCDPADVFMYFNDFLTYVTTMDGLTTVGTNAAPAMTDAAGGVLGIVTSGVDNTASLIASTNELFSLSAGKKLYFEARVKVAEANTDDINIYVGLTEGVPADAVPMLNNGGGVADDDHIGFYKADGGTVWVAKNGDGAAHYTTTNLSTRSIAAYQRLGFVADTGQIDFYIDGQKVATHTTYLPTADELMHLVIGCKAGGANAETLLLDWVKIVQTR